MDWGAGESLSEQAAEYGISLRGDSLSEFEPEDVFEDPWVALAVSAFNPDTDEESE